ncbi:hypothetical protein ACH4MD_29540 [Streptomyces rimosus]|uniref:LPXTG cell wall anchor domain-containing protein n=1 Tax=Streptomyces rimosus subsp. rimosus TaxID=132474 RepID=A0ABY3Z084_STRRM|nr:MULTISPECIES: hypothetical protein [unclassified Streptomyces]UNZ03394.1 hypothetical protein SRIMR7_14650 [Streptomyces rimosus subsp. rimosus]UTH94940.1 hypothetical protein SRIMHP_12480 [Streptomyces rimosus subsp. rimosus]UTJ13037.1 hypothetical protein SRIMDV3_12375 [Streptomyces rimosus subsp. rimosus]
MPVTARRPLLTAAAAGSVLLALWFVPSANATVEHGERTTHTPRSAQQDPTTQPQSAGQAPQGAQREPDVLLADTGAFDTTPYAIGGAAFLGIGAGLVGFSVRRTRGSEV